MASSPKKSKKRRKNPDCPHCRTGAETFRYTKGVFKFDVDLAREIISDGRSPVELKSDDVRHSVDTCRIHKQHLDHVDPTYPGIIAQIWYPDMSGEVLHGDTLIDGHHRAARCLRDGLPYFVYLLSEEESQQILLKGPNREQAEEIAASVFERPVAVG